MIEPSTLDNLKKHIAIPDYGRDDSFTNSVAYYALTGRRGAWICEKGNTKTVLCQHPNISNRLLIFPEIGDGDGSLTADILRSLDLTRQTVQLARFSMNEIDAVQAHLEDSPTIKLHPSVEKNLDWKYPIHVLDTALVSNLKGPAFRNVRNKTKQIDDEDIEIIPLSHAAAPKYLKACTKYWEGNQILYNKDYCASEEDFYQTLFDFIQTNPDMFDGFILKHGKRVSGFSIWDKPTGETANLIANLVDIHSTGLSEYQLVTTCRLLDEQGIRFLNRGGSENKGLDDFKQKFSPIRSVKLYSALVENTATMQFSFTPLVQSPILNAPSIFA